MIREDQGLIERQRGDAPEGTIATWMALEPQR